MMNHGFWFENKINKNYVIDKNNITIYKSITVPWSNNNNPESGRFLNLSSNTIATLQIKNNETLTLTLPDSYLLETMAVNIQKFGNVDHPAEYKGTLKLIIPRMGHGSCGIYLSIIDKLQLNMGIYSGTVVLYCNTLKHEFTSIHDKAAGIVTQYSNNYHPLYTDITIRNSNVYIFGSVKCYTGIKHDVVNNNCLECISVPQYIYENMTNIVDDTQNNECYMKHCGWCSFVLNTNLTITNPVTTIEKSCIEIDDLLGHIITGIIFNRNILIQQSIIKVGKLEIFTAGSAIIFNGNNRKNMYNKGYDIIKSSTLEIGDVCLYNNTFSTGYLFTASGTLLKNTVVKAGNIDSCIKHIIAILFQNTVDMDNSRLITGGIGGKAGISISFKHNPNLHNYSSIVIHNTSVCNIIEKSVGILFLNLNNTTLNIKNNISLAVFNVPYKTDNYISIQLGNKTYDQLNTNNTGLMIFPCQELLNYGSIIISNVAKRTNCRNDLNDKVICSYVMGNLINNGYLNINGNILNKSNYKNERFCKKITGVLEPD